MDIVVVGGGAAGMMAAISAAADSNDHVTLVEQNEKLGKKLFLTGKGRCNITNACPVEELFDNIVTNKKFMYSAFYDFDNAAVTGFFNDNGLATKVERGQRVFPKSDRSSDVIKTLEKKLKSLGVDIMLHSKVIRYITSQNGSDIRISGVIVKKDKIEKEIKADKVIAATGGCSYPLTGSDGTAFALFEKMGIKVNKPEPSLVPFSCSEKLITDMQGLSLKNVGVTVIVGKKEVYSGFGEMLFTHFGLSGPLILSSSSYVRQSDYEKGVKVFIDLKPALTPEELDKRLLHDFEENQNKAFSNCLGGLLPRKMITAVIERSGIAPDKKVNLVTKQERQQLCETLKRFEIKINGNRGFNEAIITRGGIATSCVNPSSMESKEIKGLYFAGEMIDVDALTGGFNLQIAWSTGHLAGTCSKEVIKWVKV